MTHHFRRSVRNWQKVFCQKSTFVFIAGFCWLNSITKHTVWNIEVWQLQLKEQENPLIMISSKKGSIEILFPIFQRNFNLMYSWRIRDRSIFYSIMPKNDSRLYFDSAEFPCSYLNLRIENLIFFIFISRTFFCSHQKNSGKGWEIQLNSWSFRLIEENMELSLILQLYIKLKFLWNIGNSISIDPFLLEIIIK